MNRPRCSPLCGAVRAYGERKALDPTSWWLHENGCPLRDQLREWAREGLSRQAVRQLLRRG